MFNRVLSTFALGLTIGLFTLPSAPAFAKTIAECDSAYEANKAAIKASGQTKKDYVAACRTGAETTPAATTPAPAPSAAPATAGGKTAKECDAEYAANKEAIKASGQTKKAYVAACEAGTASKPAAPAPAPTPMAAPAPTPTPIAPPKPAPTMAPKPAPAATGNGSASEAQAKAHCPTDTVVWVNTKSHVYHFAGSHNYGTTKQGEYKCETEAKAAGDRAAENEKHP